MKRKGLIIIIVCLAIVLIISIIIFKKQKKYTYNEIATTKRFEIVLKSATYEKETETLEAVFQLKNLSGYSITINEKEYFKLKSIAQSELNNSYYSNTNILKSNETTMYTLQYKVKERSNYEIIFNTGEKNDNLVFIVNELTK